jgi:Dolichyl-phosphate-mannose-protein mannosyltransferase
VNERVSRRQPFSYRLALITAGALVLRIAYVVWYEKTHLGPGGDALYYHEQANAIAQGHWFIEPYLWRCFGTTVQSAAHPPLYPLYLSAFSLFGGTSTLVHRLATALLGAGTVWFVGAAGREMRSERIGLVAAVIAALYPALWINDALLMSETIFAFTIALLVWSTYRYLNQPSIGRAAFIGFALALAALARAEAILLVLVLAVPLLLRRNWRHLAVAVGMTALTCMPRVAQSFARFDKPVFLSSGLGSVLAVANCHDTYYGRLLGSWSIGCASTIDNVAVGRPANARPETVGHVDGTACLEFNDNLSVKLGDESDDEALRRKASLRYVHHHLNRLTAVIPARVGRTFEVYEPTQGIEYDDFVENRGKVASRAAQYAFYVLSLFAIAGVAMYRRRKVVLLPCLAMLASVVITTALTYGNVRFRIEFDTVLPLLAALPIATVAQRLPFRARGKTVPAGEGGPPSAP